MVVTVVDCRITGSFRQKSVPVPALTQMNNATSLRNKAVLQVKGNKKKH